MKCLECRGACCESFSLPLGAVFPTGDETQDDINRWLYLHGRHDGEHITFECKCTKLSGHGRCDVYHKRPDVCRRMQAGGPECFATVGERRTPDEYQSIRDEWDPPSLLTTK